MPSYWFLGEEYTEPAKLAAAFAANWEAGKREIFRGKVTAHFRSCDPALAAKCQAAEETAHRENGRDDIIFWKLLYQIDAGRRGFIWKGRGFESLPALGRDVLERMWQADLSQYSFYNDILANRLLSQYAEMTAPNNEKLRRAAAAIEDSYQLERSSGTDMRRTFYLMAYSLSGQRVLKLDGEQFRTVGELAGYMKRLLAESLSKFENLCHRLIDYEGNLDVQLETWLMAIGRRKELEAWRASMQE